MTRTLESNDLPAKAELLDLLLRATQDGLVDWNLASGEMERDLAATDTASAAVLLPKGTRVAVGRWGKRIQLCWNGQPEKGAFC